MRGWPNLAYTSETAGRPSACPIGTGSYRLPTKRRIELMNNKPKPKPDDPAQYKRFLEAAREAGAEESGEAADQAFKQIVKPKAETKKPRR